MAIHRKITSNLAASSTVHGVQGWSARLSRGAARCRISRRALTNWHARVALRSMPA